MTKRATTAAVVVALLALTGCQPTQPASSPPPALFDAPPNEVSGLAIPPGPINDAIAKVDGLVGDLMKSTGIPGLAVAIVYGGKSVYAKGFGARDASKGDTQDNKIDADNVFQLASVSKSVVSLGPKNQSFTLAHWDGDTFSFSVTDENAPPGTISKATFSGFPGATLNLEYFDSDKLGTFTR
jgi:Beta-lactamase